MQSMPTNLSQDSAYVSSINAVLDSSSQMLTMEGTDWSVDIVGNTVSYFCLSIKERILITETDAKVAEWQA